MTEDRKNKLMPKGGRKGGIMFPRTDLKAALEYSTKLVSKTHTSRQPRDVLYTGVVGATSSRGNAKISALKQFGFLEGSEKDSYAATDLAKALVGAPPDEQKGHLKRAILNAKPFRMVFETFQDDEVSRAKIRQRAIQLGVHPDSVDDFVSVYCTSITFAGLGRENGENISHVLHTEGPTLERNPHGDEVDEPAESLGSEANGDAPTEEEAAEQTGDPREVPARGTPRAVFQVNINLDASLDTEKLERQLALLKKYGAM